MPLDVHLINPAIRLTPSGLQASDEVVEKRRPNGKTFRKPDGSFKTRTVLGIVHYKDDPDDINEAYKEIDLTIDASNNADKSVYKLKILSNKIGYSYKSKKGGKVDVELVEVGGLPVNFLAVTVRKEGNQLFWDNVATDLDLKILLAPTFVEIYKLLKTDQAPRSFKWKVTQDLESECAFRTTTVGKASNMLRTVYRTVEIETNITEEKIIGKRKEFYYEETWTGRIIIEYDRKTRQKTWSDDPNEVEYPVIIDAATQELITINSDDGREVYNSYWEDNIPNPYSGLWNVKGGTWWADGGVRFQTLGVPQGSTINTATITFDVRAIGGTPDTTIWGDDVDGTVGDPAPTWANNSRPSQITQTAASATWRPAVGAAIVVGVTGIVQEIIDRPGWNSGDLRFAIEMDGGQGAGDYADIADFNGGQADAAILDVDYTAVGRTTKNTNASSLGTSHGEGSGFFSRIYERF